MVSRSFSTNRFRRITVKSYEDHLIWKSRWAHCKEINTSNTLKA